MKIITHKKFDKAFKKAPEVVKKKFFNQIKLFFKNPSDKRLNNHALSGRYLGYRSVNITGDWRVIFKQLNEETIVLADIGTHSQLY